MKKWLAFILLAVTLTATFVPCCTTGDCCDDAMQTASQPGSKKEGACSPFITCGTCTGFTQNRLEIKVAEIATENTIHFPKEVCLILPAYFSALLQPPRSI